MNKSFRPRYYFCFAVDGKWLRFHLIYRFGLSEEVLSFSRWFQYGIFFLLPVLTAVSAHRMRESPAIFLHSSPSWYALAFYRLMEEIFPIESAFIFSHVRINTCLERTRRMVPEAFLSIVDPLPAVSLFIDLSYFGHCEKTRLPLLAEMKCDSVSSGFHSASI